MDSLNTIQEIRSGKPLTDFDEENVTPIMVLAALNVRNAWKEVPAKLRNRRFAKMALQKDFRNLETIDDKIKPHCYRIFADWATRLTRKDVADYKRILNAQEDSFIFGCMRQNNRVKQFVDSNRLPRTNRQQNFTAPSNPGTKPQKDTQVERFYVDADEFSAYDFTDTELGSADELNPEAYLARPVKLQTIEDLEQLLSLPDRFPADFIDRLQMPYRNAAFYQAQNDTEKAQLWKDRQIPWLNKAVCLHIAQMHPEASIKTPGYLTKDSVMEYWQWTLENDISDKTRTEYYLGFPAELLDKSMLKDIDIDWRIIRHTPDFFIEETEEGRKVFSDAARKYLNKHPNDVFRLPRQFQTITKLISDGTVLNIGNIVRIEDPEIRALIACAMGLELPEQEQMDENLDILQGGRAG